MIWWWYKLPSLTKCKLCFWAEWNIKWRKAKMQRWHTESESENGHFPEPFLTDTSYIRQYFSKIIHFLVVNWYRFWKLHSWIYQFCRTSHRTAQECERCHSLYSSSTWNWGIYYFVCSHILVSTTALDGIDLWLILMSGHCSLEMLYGKTQRLVSLSVLCHSSAAGMGNRHRRDATENYVPPFCPHTSLC